MMNSTDMAAPSSGPPATVAGDTAALNELLRGELSAVETYTQAAKKFEGGPVAVELQTLADEHRHAADTLRSRVLHYGGDPSQGSGPWGVFAAAVTGAAKVIGPETVLAALKRGEEHGINEYQKAQENSDLSSECQFLIRSDLLPRCHRHVARLDEMMATLRTQ